MFLLPFSPRWLAKQGRDEEAKATMIRLHGGRTAHIEIVEEEFREMQLQIEWERENLSTNIMDLVNTRPNLHRTICGCLVQAMCQWTGVNVGAYFGPTIYASLGFEGQTTLMINGLSGAWGVVTTFIFIVCHPSLKEPTVADMSDFHRRQARSKEASHHRSYPHGHLSRLAIRYR
jgi:hypothetical protein